MSPTRLEPDNGLRLALMLADEDLAAIHNYFLARCDTTSDDRPNLEMTLADAVARVRGLHGRIAAGRPTSKLTYATGGQ